MANSVSSSGLAEFDAASKVALASFWNADQLGILLLWLDPLIPILILRLCGSAPPDPTFESWIFSLLTFYRLQQHRKHLMNGSTLKIEMSVRGCLNAKRVTPFFICLCVNSFFALSSGSKILGSMLLLTFSPWFAASISFSASVCSFTGVLDTFLFLEHWKGINVIWFPLTISYLVTLFREGLPSNFKINKKFKFK